LYEVQDTQVRQVSRVGKRFTRVISLVNYLENSLQALTERAVVGGWSCYIFSKLFGK